MEYLCIALVRSFPEKTVKRLLAGGLLKFITLPEAERAEWQEAINAVMPTTYPAGRDFAFCGGC